MTKFEEYLINNGYIKFEYVCNKNKDPKFIETNKHFLSTMNNLDYRYVHKDDPIIKIIKRGEFVPLNLQNNVFIFGLHEFGKPPILIYPRPNCNVIRMEDGVNVYYDEFYDDTINIILSKFTPMEIIEAIKNNELLEIDLT